MIMDRWAVSARFFLLSYFQEFRVFSIPCVILDGKSHIAVYLFYGSEGSNGFSYRAMVCALLCQGLGQVYRIFFASKSFSKDL